MSSVQGYRRFPAVKCWIQHLFEGKYLPEEKSLFTIFGKVKRIRLLATIHDKREFLLEQAEDDLGYDGDLKSTHRIDFDLEDGTGRIRATLWRVNPEDYEGFKKGDILDVVGLIRKYQKFLSISPEIMKKVENPNKMLLRDAEIIKNLKTEEIFEIPKISEDNFDLEDVSEKIDVDSLFEDNDDKDIHDIKEDVYLKIEESTLEGNGIRFEDLREIFNLSENELRKVIRDLEMESKIYPSEEDLYQTY